MRDDAALEAFQAELLELLDAGVAPDEVKRRMRAHPAVAAAGELAAWIDGWEPRCVETASLLVRKWGHRKGAPPSETPAG